jgi:hypothetical protein
MQRQQAVDRQQDKVIVLEQERRDPGIDRVRVILPARRPPAVNGAGGIECCLEF